METTNNNECLSFINGKICRNGRNEGNWCEYCVRILLPKYNRYKKLEERYYNLSVAAEMDGYDTHQLLRIYARISEIIRLREEVRNLGFRPEYRDLGHLQRIEGLYNFLQRVEKILTKKYEETEIKQEQTEVDDSEEDLPNVGEAVISVSIPKPIIRKTEEELMEQNNTYARSCSDFIRNIMTVDLFEAAYNFTSTKFGKMFVRAFILQQNAFKTLCHHGEDIVRENSRFRASKSTRQPQGITVSISNIKHRYVSHREIIHRLCRGEYRIHEIPVDRKYTASCLPTVTQYDIPSHMIKLYQYFPHIELPKYIEYIKFEIDDSILSEINTVWEKIPEPQEKYVRALKNKIELLKTRKGKSMVCFNNCVRVDKLSRVEADEQLVVELLPSLQTNLMAIRTIKQKKDNPGVDLEATIYDRVDVSGFKCDCTDVVVIKLRRNEFDFVRNWEYFLCVNTIYSPYIFI